MLHFGSSLHRPAFFPELNAAPSLLFIAAALVMPSGLHCPVA